MSVFTRVFNATLFVCATATLAGCPPFEAEPLPDPEQCRPGETRPSDDGCNTCVCEDDGSWSCTERGCGPVCDPEEVLVDGECQPGCYGDQDCGEGQSCTAEEQCLAPPGAGDGLNAPAVCYGVCQDDEPVCPAIGCPPIECEFGTLLDDAGCDTCQCAPPPMCEPVNCEIACEFGFVTDDTGCEICACNPPPACEPVACDIYCEYGHVVDERGCDICACNPPPEPRCEPGFVEVDGECYAGCYGGQDCGEAQRCNAEDICLPPPNNEGPDGDPDPDGARPPQPAVCYGYCEDAEPEPPVCVEPNAPFYYVGNSPDECSVIDFRCAEGAEHFANECGCGCIGTECYPGDQREAGDGCNTCECTAEGFWACTEIACDIDG